METEIQLQPPSFSSGEMEFKDLYSLGEAFNGEIARWEVSSFSSDEERDLAELGIYMAFNSYHIRVRRQSTGQLPDNSPE